MYYVLGRIARAYGLASSWKILIPMHFLDNIRIDAANIAVVSGTGDSAMSALL